MVLKCCCIVHLFFPFLCAESFARMLFAMIDDERVRKPGTHTTVKDEQASINNNNWADEIDELNSRVTEQHLRAIFWRRARKPAAQGKRALDEKIASSATAEGKEAHGALALE